MNPDIHCMEMSSWFTLTPAGSLCLGVSIEAAEVSKVGTLHIMHYAGLLAVARLHCCTACRR